VKTLWLIAPVVMQSASRDDPEQALLACPMASARLRIAVAALEWKRCGNKNIFWDPGAAGSRRGNDSQSAEICVVPKYYYDAPLQPWLDACAAAKSRGCRLVIDICDYPFKKPAPVPAFYSEVLKICDAVVVNSERMAELMTAHSAHHPLVIEDAILASMGEPAFSPRERVELVWFGHPINFVYLDACIEALARLASRRHCRLTVVTEKIAKIERWIQAINAHFGPAFQARLIPWSLETQRGVLRECDLVLVPSDPADALKAGASANRIAEALNAGRFPVASPLPSYLAFADAAWLGQDLIQGIEWALANRDEVLARIRRGQALVREKFAADRIGRQWRELLESLAGSPGSQR
jgi:glycosyltransferase involved in cell wall biosynthesis